MVRFYQTKIICILNQTFISGAAERFYDYTHAHMKCDHFRIWIIVYAMPIPEVVFYF